ncbi:MAG: hypothetical protein ACK2UW_17485 [Anaerolineales bacterium]|jgi:hypothetical protein
MNMLTAYYIDNLAKDHWQQAREANQYGTVVSQASSTARPPMAAGSLLKQRFAVILNKLHLGNSPFSTS